MTQSLLIAALMGVFVVPVADAANGPEKEKKVMGISRPGEALVYIVRRGAMMGGGARVKVFCNDQLAGNMKNNSYTFVYLRPGTHIVWVEYTDSAPFDVAAGQTYYLAFKVGDPLSLLSAAEGEAAIAKSGRYIETDEEDRSKAAGTIAKKWPKYKAKVESKTAPPSEVVAYKPPASTENMVKVPAGTAIDVELMENLNSGINQVSEAVWVRATEDVRVDGKLFVLKGTPVKALLRGVEDRGGFRRGGKLDLTMVSLAAADGTVCPLVGQMATIGAKGSQVGSAAAAAAGLGAAVLVSAVTRGSDSFYLAGEAARAFTREDIWIKPLDSAVGSARAPEKPSDSVKGYARGKITCNFRKGEVPKSVEIVFGGAADVASVELFQVAGGEIPFPVRPANLSRVNEEWVAQYDGWAISRYLRAGDTGNQLGFRLTASNGTATIAQVKVTIVLER